MFCSKCGNENTDDAAFCKSCGENLKNKGSDKTDKKSKSKKVTIGSIITGVALLVYVAGIIFNGTTDYVTTLKTTQPLTGEGLTYTYNDVFSDLIEDVEWKSYKDDGTQCVDVSGTMKGTDEEVVFTFTLEKISESSDLVSIELKHAILNRSLLDSDVASSLVYEMFYLHDSGGSDMTDLLYYFD